VKTHLQYGQDGLEVEIPAENVTVVTPRYVEGLPQKVVRGRSADAIVDDAKVREQLYVEIKDELKRLPPAPMSDPDHVARTIKNYLTQKL